MSLLWKKPKSNRLSRFMSEFQQSPKRGGIMVVETGFPTSLIHLFVKNRDRLKKSSAKTKRIKRLIQTAPNASLPTNPDASLENPVARKTAPSNIEKVNFVGGGLTAENKHTSDTNVCVCSSGSGAFVLMAFKIFIVAMFALSTTKNLTMGITLSALALLFIENVAARVLTTRFKLCNTDTQKEKLLASIHDDNVVYCGKIETFDASRDQNAKPCTKAVSCLEERDSVSVTENSNSKDSRIRNLLLKDEKSTSKSSRLQSKILKKLRSYKRKKNERIVIKEETLIDVSSLFSEDKSEAERDEEKLNPPLTESKGDNMMNGIVVIVIVLTGLLLSGKILAIGLTLSCLYLKFGVTKKYGLCI